MKEEILNKILINTESDGFYNLNFAVFCIEEYYNNNNNFNIIDLKNKYLNKKERINSKSKNYVNQVNNAFSGKINHHYSILYLNEIIEAINDIGEDYFYLIFNKDIKTIKFAINDIFNNKNMQKIVDFNKTLFCKNFINKLVYNGTGSFKNKTLIKMEDGKIIAPLLNIFIENFFNNLFENDIIPKKILDLKRDRFKGLVGEKLISNKLKNQISNFKFIENIHYYEEKNSNNLIELDFILENKNYLILGSVKNIKLNKNMKEKVFNSQTKQTRRFHESLVKNGSLDIYEKIKLENNKETINKIDNISLNENKKIIHLGISIEFISDYIFNFETPKIVNQELINQSIISYSDFSTLLNIISLNDYVEYLSERSEFSKIIKTIKNLECKEFAYLDDEFIHFNLYLKNVNNYIEEEKKELQRQKAETLLNPENPLFIMTNNKEAIEFDENISYLYEKNKKFLKYDIIDLFYFNLENREELKYIKNNILFKSQLEKKELKLIDEKISIIKKDNLKEIKFKKEDKTLIFSQKDIDLKNKNEILIRIQQNK